MPVLAPGIRNQSNLDDLLDFSGTITTGNTAQLVLPQQIGRLSIFIANTATTDTLYVGIGPPRPTVTRSSGQITAVTVGNAGVGYTVPPVVRFLGGLVAGNLREAPSHPAVAHATLSGTGIGSITVDDPGAGYTADPIIYLENPISGPFGQLGGGAFLPSSSGTLAGIPLPPGWSLNFEGSMLVPTSAVALVAATNSDPFTIKVGGLV